MILDKKLYIPLGYFKEIQIQMKSLILLIKDNLMRSSNDTFSERGVFFPKLFNNVNLKGKCTDCFDCKEICPTSCLNITCRNDDVVSFIINIGACISCSLCVDVCDDKLLEMIEVETLALLGEQELTCDLIKLSDYNSNKNEQ